MAKVTIVGFEDRSYTNKSTGEVTELLDLHFTKLPKGDSVVGNLTGSVTVHAKYFPDQFSEIKRARENVIGKKALISMDVRTFKDSSFPVLDDLEILGDE